MVWGKFWIFAEKIPCWKYDENYRCFLGKKEQQTTFHQSSH